MAGFMGLRGPGWRHTAVCVAGKSLPDAGETVSRIAAQVRRKRALVYSVWGERLRSVLPGSDTAAVKKMVSHQVPL